MRRERKVREEGPRARVIWPNDPRLCLRSRTARGLRSVTGRVVGAKHWRVSPAVALSSLEQMLRPCGSAVSAMVTNGLRRFGEMSRRSRRLLCLRLRRAEVMECDRTYDTQDA